MGDNTENNIQTEKLKINWEPLKAVFGLFYTVVKYFGFVFFGIVIGAGVVLKNPPQDTALVKKMRELEEQNNNLKIKLAQPEFLTKESVVIK